MRNIHAAYGHARRPSETQREWGRTIAMDADVQHRIDGIFVGLVL